MHPILKQTTDIALCISQNTNTLTKLEAGVGIENGGSDIVEVYVITYQRNTRPMRGVGSIEHYYKLVSVLD